MPFLNIKGGAFFHLTQKYASLLTVCRTFQVHNLLKPIISLDWSMMGIIIITKPNRLPLCLYLYLSQPHVVSHYMQLVSFVQLLPLPFTPVHLWLSRKITGDGSVQQILLCNEALQNIIDSCVEQINKKKKNLKKNNK